MTTGKIITKSNGLERKNYEDRSYSGFLQTFVCLRIKTVSDREKNFKNIFLNKLSSTGHCEHHHQALQSQVLQHRSSWSHYVDPGLYHRSFQSHSMFITQCKEKGYKQNPMQQYKFFLNSKL